jgi:hypothetical protein
MPRDAAITGEHEADGKSELGADQPSRDRDLLSVEEIWRWTWLSGQRLRDNPNSTQLTSAAISGRQKWARDKPPRSSSNRAAPRSNRPSLGPRNRPDDLRSRAPPAPCRRPPPRRSRCLTRLGCAPGPTNCGCRAARLRQIPSSRPSRGSGRRPRGAPRAGRVPPSAPTDQQGRSLLGRHVERLDDVLDAERHAVDR